MKQFDVWLEGWYCDGPLNLGSHEAETFQQACEKAVNLNYELINTGYDPTTNSFWGLQFYDNEKDARSFYG